MVSIITDSVAFRYVFLHICEMILKIQNVIKRSLFLNLLILRLTFRKGKAVSVKDKG